MKNNECKGEITHNDFGDIMNPIMTICIAAVADRGKKVVAGTDNMITHTIGGTVTYEVETPTNKKAT